ncbi:hypothetical protein [Aestuariibacter salexigens]|uniref:hypothetical protein n=1 Tax=Aestuariibacter salexigens TaxID=226010 RepID=UPI000405607F|nr:hypothetical protein [Aestuariibacter salexigens]
MRIKKVTRLWSKAAHNAFTDLCFYQGNLFCCFREARTHISEDGTIRILCLDQCGEILSHGRLHMPNTDLRDPKLTVTPDGKLLLYAYARLKDRQTGKRVSRNINWFSRTGQSWSSPRFFGAPFHWLWRQRFYKGRAYGLAYCATDESLHLFAGDPRRTFECEKRDLLGLATHGVGYPNESDIMFDAKGTMIALVRRDADTGSAKLGIAAPPYQRWQWHDLGTYIGCPVIYPLSDRQAIVVGRDWQRKGPRTVLYELNIAARTVGIIDTLPSSGDNSYPGIVSIGDKIWISYYSSHEDHKSSIYLASYQRDTLLNLIKYN